MAELAPIAIFVHSRPNHTRRLIESLNLCPEFASSRVYVFADAAKKPEHEEPVEETRRVVKELLPASTQFVFRDQNMGLANSIITGVGELTAEHGRVIVVEDDLIFQPLALSFLNQGLDFFEQEDRVMHVSAYMFPVRATLPPAFCLREATCWGWGTWARAWKHFNADSKELLERVAVSHSKEEFNSSDSIDFFGMLQQQAEGKLDSWAIRWYASMFLSGGLSLHPGRSFVFNDGFDGTGVHCSETRQFDITEFGAEVPSFAEVEVALDRSAFRSLASHRQAVREAEARLHRQPPKRLRPAKRIRRFLGRLLGQN